jgi:hypothetical protein
MKEIILQVILTQLKEHYPMRDVVITKNGVPAYVCVWQRYNEPDEPSHIIRTYDEAVVLIKESHGIMGRTLTVDCFEDPHYFRIELEDLVLGLYTSKDRQ